ncbi:MAG: hypothetical protein EOO73_22945 [Myxococcales bacterium]|nr:MAG: hypothetical protein EOO73_22945 [Myxococcales bacterium]
MADETEEVEESSGPSFNAEMLKSYLIFAKHAIRAHRAVIGVVVFLGLVLTGLVVKFIPRTYSCTTVLMTVENAVLDGNGGGRPLVGAEGLMMRRENLEQLVKKTDLVHKYQPRRPPLLRTKDRIMAALFGPLDDKTLLAILVPTLENRLAVGAKGDTLEIKVDWNDAATTAELAKAAQDGFLELRHRAEISAFQEKMGILDSHSAKLREEIDALAQQMRASLEAKAADLTKTTGKSGAPTLRSVASFGGSPRPATPSADGVLPELREKLLAAKAKLAAAEGERSSRISQERAKLDELKLHLTPNHPQVITQAERLNAAQDVSSDLALLRSEVSDMEVQVKQRDAMAKTGPLGPSRGGSLGGATVGPTTEMLPADLVRLLESSEIDPALSAQMSGAVVRYASLRDEVRGAKLALDTAQAAFNHRYQVVIPVEEPSKPIKPALPVLAIAGIVLSLLIGFAIPVLLELKRGVLVERWQVEHFQLPVLADLRLPERTDK